MEGDLDLQLLQVQAQIRRRSMTFPHDVRALIFIKKTIKDVIKKTYNTYDGVFALLGAALQKCIGKLS